MAFTDLRDEMEPAVKDLSLQIAPEISIAISMKRIADFICGSSNRLDVVQYLHQEIKEAT